MHFNPNNSANYSDANIGCHGISNDILLRNLALLSKDAQTQLFTTVLNELVSQHDDQKTAAALMLRNYRAFATALGKMDVLKQLSAGFQVHDDQEASEPESQMQLSQVHQNSSLRARYELFYKQLLEDGKLTESEYQHILNAGINEINSKQANAIARMNLELESLKPELAKELEQFGRGLAEGISA